MTIGERIKKVRQEKSLTQQHFGERIGLKRNSLALIETGRNPSEQTIISICREFNVNETWLRTGEGEMYLPEREELILDDSSLSELERSLIRSYIKAPAELRKYLKQAVLEAAAKETARPEQSTLFTPEELAAYEKVKAAKERLADPQRAALHAELDAALDEKKRASAASASSASSEKPA